MTEPPATHTKRDVLASNPKQATAVGISSGTGLVGIAHIIGTSTLLGQIILYLAPAASYLVAIAIYYLNVQANRYVEYRLVQRARKTLEQQLANPRTSRAHKAKLLKMLEDLEESVAVHELERVKLNGVPQFQSLFDTSTTPNSDTTI